MGASRRCNPQAGATTRGRASQGPSGVSWRPPHITSLLADVSWLGDSPMDPAVGLWGHSREGVGWGSSGHFWAVHPLSCWGSLLFFPFLLSWQILRPPGSRPSSKRGLDGALGSMLACAEPTGSRSVQPSPGPAAAGTPTQQTSCRAMDGGWTRGCGALWPGAGALTPSQAAAQQLVPTRVGQTRDTQAPARPCLVLRSHPRRRVPELQSTGAR